MEMLSVLHQSDKNNSPALKFTPRGKEVFDCILKGLSDCQTAEVLGISHCTVRNHREKMLWQNDCDSMRELVARYYGTAHQKNAE